MGEMINEINAQMAMLPQLVQYWMNWMGIIFLLSILFVWKRKAARYVLLAMLLPMPIGLFIYSLSQNVNLMGIGHLVFWTPLLYYLVRFEIKSKEFEFKSIYGVWLGLLMATIAISLVFDVRDVVLVAMGYK